MRTLLLTLTTCLFVISAQAKYSGGTGEPNDPYRIATAADLIVLGETPEDYHKHFILTADIDLDPNLPGRKVFERAVIAPDANLEQQGFQNTPFTGVFDGNGHTISHLTILSTNNNTSVALFQWVNGSSAEVKNLRLFKPDVKCGDGFASASSLVAGLTDGTVSNCHVQDCNVSSPSFLAAGGLVSGNNGTITECHVSGRVIGSGHAVGGLAASNGENGTIMRCSFSGSLPGPQACGSRCTGGLVGDNSGGISFCYSTGSVSGCHTGGLVGWNSGVLYSCYSTSDVEGSSGAGGLVGGNGGGGLVSNCYSTGTVSAPLEPAGGPGGLVGWPRGAGSATGCFWDTQTSGQTTSAGGVGLTTSEMQTTSIFLDFAWDFVGETANGTEDIWWIDEGRDYPRLWWELVGDEEAGPVKN